MELKSNVIELSRYRTAAVPCAAYDRREARRARAQQRGERILTVVETLVTCAIGVGFGACVLLFFTML